ncbi:MAG: hypothetical protein KDC95_16275 [Planctomycetes bacterium]|nr:hypothetical protein [Planctomycetota bacterium]
MNTFPMTLPLIVALTAGGVAHAQNGTNSLQIESYGVSCGAQLNGSIATRRLAITVTDALPGQPVAIVIGSHAQSLALPGSPCRLLTSAQLSVPLIANSRGAASLEIPLPGTFSSFFAQAIAHDAGKQRFVGSQGLAVHDAAKDDRVIAVVRASGSYIRFVESEPGELLIVAIDVTKAQRDAFARYESGAITAAELYTSLSGLTAPSALRALSVKVANARKSEAIETPLQGSIRSPFFGVVPGAVPGPHQQGGNVGPAACNSASWFTGMYCNHPGDFEYCWTNLTGNPWVQKYCHAMYGRVASVSGNFGFAYKRWNGSNWYIVWSTNVTTCQTFYCNASYSSPRHWRRMDVAGGNGDLKHFRVAGYN